MKEKKEQKEKKEIKVTLKMAIGISIIIPEFDSKNE